MASKLSTYRAKRDPHRTPEPMGQTGTAAPTSSPSFVIQEHHARALHWDFRLERDGVLVSWALPKGLPVTPKDNHLAVPTEDHPLEYGSFEGEIPAGEYGGGTVTIWDHGTFDLEKWQSDEIKVVLHGERVDGRYVLFPTGENWMIHRMDPAPRGFEPMPESVAPMLAKSGELPTRDEDWAYEFKWDGVRALVYVDGGRVRALTRNGKDLVHSFPELRDVGEFLGSRSAILDGEIVALDDASRPNFPVLAHRLHVSSPSMVARLMKSTPVSFLAFDILYFEGRSCTGDSYDDRRQLLESLKLQGATFATPPSLHDSSGREVFAIARERGLEGVVLKRRASSYLPGQRNGDWIKVKNFHTQEVVVGGWTDGTGSRAPTLGALLLGLPSDDGLVYVGKVGTGFTEGARRDLLDVLQPLTQESSPFRSRLSPSDVARCHFVSPTTVGEVQFMEWTSDGHLRHPSWRGLRPDKNAAEVRRES